jgi:uncharacterized protein (TIGR02145 family)
MKKILILGLLLLGAVNMNGQVRIGGTVNPDASAILDLNKDTILTGNNTKGLALPRVTLIATNNVTYPIANPIVGMHVYNTNFAGGGTAYVVNPGEYYFDGVRWVRVRNSNDPIDYTDLSKLAISSLTELVQSLIASGGVVTNNCPDSIRGIDNTNWYKIGDFGAAGCWMTENYKDSVNINARRFTGKVYADSVVYGSPGNNSALIAQYGLLYSWKAATGKDSIGLVETYPAENPITRGICPVGWHVPSDLEFAQFVTTICSDASARWRKTNSTTTLPSTFLTSQNILADSLSFFLAPEINGSVANSPKAISKINRGPGWVHAPTYVVQSWTAEPTKIHMWTSSRCYRGVGESWGDWRNLGHIYRTSYTTETMFSLRCKKD